MPFLCETKPCQATSKFAVASRHQDNSSFEGNRNEPVAFFYPRDFPYPSIKRDSVLVV
jgi:hypothetical protein